MALLSMRQPTGEIKISADATLDEIYSELGVLEIMQSRQCQEFVQELCEEFFDSEKNLAA